jgi:uncharacterized iron-regulated protein
MHWRLPFPLLAAGLSVALLLPACATSPQDPVGTERADVVLLGEQHDAAAHQRMHQDAVRTLASQGRLAALALEMAEAGTSTSGLPPAANEAAVQAALRWDAKAWPWPAYGPAVMAAVQAGVPVLGANLPRAAMRPAMLDAQLDKLLPASALAAQHEAIRQGHCDLLPPAQIAPMARIQIARDRAMAGVVAAAAVPGKTVVLLAGAGHVDETIGVPRHLPAGLTARSLRWPAEAPAKDYCAELRERLPAR